jgi:hypothetical protein
MSLLTIIQDAQSICGIGASASAFGSADPTVAQFVALAQVEGDELARFHDWRSMKVLGILTGDGASTLWDLPADFDRFAPGRVFWSDEGAGAALDMVSDDELVAMKAQGTEPPFPVWRLFGDQIEIWPALELGENVTTEYRSEFWILDNDGVTRKARWAADTDRAIIPERLITLGLVWRWKQSKGLEYSEAFRSYQFERTRQAMGEGGRSILRMRDTFGDDVAKMGRPAYYKVIV